MSEIKKGEVENIYSRMDQAKERICELEDRKVEGRLDGSLG